MTPGQVLSAAGRGDVVVADPQQGYPTMAAIHTGGAGKPWEITGSSMRHGNGDLLAISGSWRLVASGVGEVPHV